MLSSALSQLISVATEERLWPFGNLVVEQSPQEKKELPGRQERLIRALLLLAASVLFSTIAWALGLYRLQDGFWLYGMIGGVIVLALLTSRIGAKLIIRRLSKRLIP
jgi:hypothetical protein